jgi:hypothetical protein
MNKIMHGVVLAFFAFTSWLIALVLKLPMMMAPVPAFTRLCMAAGPLVLMASMVLALAYCISIWMRRGETRASWVSFLATTMAAAILMLIPALIAICLPIVDVIRNMPRS